MPLVGYGPLRASFDQAKWVWPDCNKRAAGGCLLSTYPRTNGYLTEVIPAETSPVLNGEQPVDRAELHRWARDQLRQVRRTLRQYHRTERRYRKAVMRARVPQQRERVQQRLAAMPVEDLARGSKINTAALHRGGVTTAADVNQRTVEALERIRDIGPKSARRIKDLAAKSARTRPDDLRPPGNPDTWKAADYALVRGLAMLALVSALAPHAAVLQQAVQAVRWLARATSWLAWLFSTPSHKARVRSAAPGIRQVWLSSRAPESLQKLLAGLDQAQNAAAAPDSAVASEWRTSSSSLLPLLEQLLASKGTAEEQDILRRGLATRFSPELLNQIESIALNTTRLALRLRLYQDFGARFAVAVGRGLLGDDMGLGKTVQALAAIAHVTETDGQQHHVVVCPASLIDTWLQEIRRALPDLPCWRFHGTDRDTAFRDWQEAAGILVTSFRQAEHLLARNHAPVGFAIVDEAHLVKNPQAQRTQIVRSLTGRASRVLLMSGTPMENRASEFIALTTIADPRQGARLREQFGDGRDAHRDAAAFRDAMGDMYLRRNQDEVLTELPGIISADMRIEVGEDEHLACKHALAGRNLNGARIALTTGDGERSAKMTRLAEIIAECQDANKKVLIFSQFRRVLETCRAIIGEETLVIHGDVPLSKRPEITRRFQEADGFAALVMQIDVGGVGLNLQAASVVILMEPQLKPSTEQQAVGRAHRMGQTRPVVVYRLIAADSIDERIVELSGFKTELFDQLARRSVLAEAASELPVGMHDVNEGELLAWARERYGL
jgi:superfamily II DNA or RNA helicase